MAVKKSSVLNKGSGSAAVSRASAGAKLERKPTAEKSRPITPKSKTGVAKKKLEEVRKDKTEVASVAKKEPKGKKKISGTSPATLIPTEIRSPDAPSRGSDKSATKKNSSAKHALTEKPLPVKKKAALEKTPGSVVLESASTINTGRASTAPVAANPVRADIAKGIEARKAAAKAKSIAKLGRPIIKKADQIRKLTQKQSRDFEEMLLRIRDKLSRQIAFLRGTSLTRTDEVNPEEDGTDAFERQLALKLAANEGDAVFEIDEALQRIKDGTYGICQDCECVINASRLKAIPFVRRCVQCKAIAEKGRDLNSRRYF